MLAVKVVILARDVGMAAAVLYGLVQLGTTVWTILPPSQQAAIVRSIAQRLRRLAAWMIDVSAGYDALAWAIEARTRTGGVQ